MENNLASIWRRLVAVAIDAALILIVLRLVYLRTNTFPGLIDPRLVAFTVLFIAYEALAIFYLGATLGKRVMGILVTDRKTFETPSLVKCVVRPWTKLFFGLMIFNLAIVQFIALLFEALNLTKMLGDSRRRAIHDIVAGTVVLQENKRR